MAYSLSRYGGGEEKKTWPHRSLSPYSQLFRPTQLVIAWFRKAHVSETEFLSLLWNVRRAPALLFDRHGRGIRGRLYETHTCSTKCARDRLNCFKYNIMIHTKIRFVLNGLMFVLHSRNT